jgi:DNA repair exonuclease SbcCD ATPase subunit
MNVNTQQTLGSRKAELARKQAENALLGRQIGDIEQKIIGLVSQLEIGQEALQFLTDLADSRRGAMKVKIETILTEALRLIYGNSYRVEFTYSHKNNRSCLEIEMVRDTPAGEVRRDISGFGGGVADTISVPLRLMVLMGSRQTDRVCILDECWKHMDNERIELVGKFLRLLADQLKIQIIICSHHEQLRDFADRIYEVSEQGGVSKVEVV